MLVIVIKELEGVDLKTRTKLHINQTHFNIWMLRLFSVLRHQRGRIEVLHDGVVTDRQVKLVAAEDQAVVDGVSDQVDAGAHDERDDAQVHGGARQRRRTSFYQLQRTPDTPSCISLC